MHKFHLKKPLQLPYGCVMVVRLCYGCVHWVNHEKGEHSMSAAATAAVPIWREETCLQFLCLLEFSSSSPTHALPTMGSTNSVHSEIQQDNWRHKQDGQRYNWHSWQDTQRVGESEAPLDGGSQWPPDSIWYCVASVLLTWAPVGRLGSGGWFTG